jgi:hypothetical protein
MLYRQWKEIALILVLAVSGPLGCSSTAGNEDALVPVAGRIMYKGEPVRGAVVTFVPDADRPVVEGFGRTDSEGRFKIETYSVGSGVPPGHYKVTVTHYTRDHDLPRNYQKSWLTPLAVDIGPSGASDLVLIIED